MKFDELLTSIPISMYGVNATEYFIANYPELYDSTKHYVTQWCLGPALFASKTEKPFVVYGDYAKTDAMDGYGKIDDMYGIRPEVLVDPSIIPVTEHADAALFGFDPKGEVKASILPFTDLATFNWNDRDAAKIVSALMVYEYALNLSTDEYMFVLISGIDKGVTFFTDGSTFIVVLAKNDTEAYSFVYRNMQWNLEWRTHSRTAEAVVSEYLNASIYQSFTFSGSEFYAAITYFINNS